MGEFTGSVDLVGWLFQRGLALLYFVAFLSALKQFPALLGEKGLLPTPDFVSRIPFSRAPSMFYFHYSDRFFRLISWACISFSLLIFFGVFDHLHWSASVAAWLFLWASYLSIVNVGQTFYSFGWESMLLEAGFFTAFLGPLTMQVPLIPVILLRWMLFRVEFGAGLIKLRHDKCWRDLTCLYYHYETQPLPNPLSWLFHRFPKFVHRSGVVFSHFVQVIVPWGLFAPQPISSIAGALIIFHQLLLIVSGNYSWLNWLTVCLGITAFSDATLKLALPWLPGLTLQASTSYPTAYNEAMFILLGVTALLSVQPAINLCSKQQLMNFNYNPLHLVNTCGAFGSMSRKRYEVVIEGTQDASLDSGTQWKEYEFKAKPGDLRRMPPQVAPYHLRLDWLMWFIPFGVRIIRGSIISYGYDAWFVMLVEKLLQADRETLKLLKSDPFAGERPSFIRARYYLYEFTSKDELSATGSWWKRTLIGDYLTPVGAADLAKPSIHYTM